MIKTADILIEGYRPGVMKRLGLDYETVSEVNTSLNGVCFAYGFS